MSIRLIVFASFVFIILNVASQNDSKYSFETNLSYGRLLAHRTVMKNLIENNSYSLESTVNFNTNGSKLYERYYHYPSFGITINYTHSGNNEQIGSIISSYAFFTLPLNKTKNAMRFKLGLGVGWIEKIFDLETNFQNIAIGSHINTNIQIKFEKTINLKNLKQLKFALLLNHLSNGSFKTPNLGLNFIQLQTGYLIGFFQNKIDTTRLVQLKNKPTQLVLYNSSAFKENQAPENKKYYINETTLQFSFRKGLKTSFFTGTDIIVNNSLIDFNKNKLQVGVFAGHIMHLDKLKIGVQLGSYLFNRKDKSESIYNKLFCEYELHKKVFARLSLKSHWAKADFFSLGIGYRLI